MWQTQIQEVVKTFGSTKIVVYFIPKVTWAPLGCTISKPPNKFGFEQNCALYYKLLCACASETIDLSLTNSTNLWDSWSSWLMKNRNRWRNARVDQFDCWRHAKNIFRAVENIPFNAEVWLGWTSSGAAPTRPMYRSAWKHRHSAYHPPTTLSCLPVTIPKPRQRRTNTTLIEWKN